ncbi:hypothetical protein [Candidatus Magnetaquicoccus inordinatus]|uniref:hypothetical protein n=1 Tax=Candidatus Magnetaquicoccus inordinatus TaxID=2496818 RepID=UPI00102B06ED|nr:hypothetical protein [Candidatus Magnetaquicoccus inordinatus]
MKKIILLLGVVLGSAALLWTVWVIDPHGKQENYLLSEQTIAWQRPVTGEGVGLKMSARLHLPQNTWQLAQAKLSEWGVPSAWLSSNGSLALTGIVLAIIL